MERRSICTGISAGPLGRAKVRPSAFFSPVLLMALSPPLGLKNMDDLLVVTWPVPEKLSSVSPLHQSINQAAHCSELPLLRLAACINHINTLGVSKLPNHKVPKQRAEEDAGAFLSGKTLTLPFCQEGQQLFQVGPLVPWWQELSESGAGVSTGGAKALSGWEKVQDYRGGSYSEFPGATDLCRRWSRTFARGGAVRFLCCLWSSLCLHSRLYHASE